ncbi:MAG: methyltransferase domain-containing protein [Lachnospiraceae bacterium]|nr:methyltransferase domain-containing protein [Lachnospiraceae bacterium]
MFEKQLLDIKENNNTRAALVDMKAGLKEDGAVKALKENPLYDIRIFKALLENEDAKVRKNAALIIGMIDEPSCADDLMKAYMNEEKLFVKSSYLAALKAYDCSKYRDELINRRDELENGCFDDADMKHISAELKELYSIFPHSGLVKHKFHNPNQPVEVIFTTGKDTVEALMNAVGEFKNAAGIKQIFCGVSFKTTEIRAVSSIRIYREMLFPVNGLAPSVKSEIASDIMSGNLMHLLEAMHDDADKPFRFRVTSKTDTAEAAARIQAASGGRLINSPSDYEIEIKLIPSRSGGYGIMLKLHTWSDRRFAYRRDYVAASMKPVNAVMMVYLVRDYLKEDAQILDPFCGVGTILIERNKAVRASHMYGIDTFGEAVAKARINTAAAGVNINYINRNFFDFRHEYKFDEIITQMPDDTGVYDDFLDKCAELLSEDGLIIMLSKEKNLIKKQLRLSDKFSLVREFPFNSKENLNIYIIKG